MEKRIVPGVKEGTGMKGKWMWPQKGSMRDCGAGDVPGLTVSVSIS